MLLPELEQEVVEGSTFTLPAGMLFADVTVLCSAATTDGLESVDAEKPPLLMSAETPLTCRCEAGGRSATLPSEVHAIAIKLGMAATEKEDASAPVASPKASATVPRALFVMDARAFASAAEVTPGALTAAVHA